MGVRQMKMTRDSFEWKLIEKLNAETMRMSYNDGPQKGWIRDLYKILDKKLPKKAKAHNKITQDNGE